MLEIDTDTVLASQGNACGPTPLDQYPSVLLEVRASASGLTVFVNSDLRPSIAGRLLVEEFGRQWDLPAGGVDSCSTIEWTDTEVTVRTSRQNPTVLYLWCTSKTNRVLMGTDLAELTARIITTSGPEPDLLAQIRSVRTSIRKVSGGRTVVFARDADRGISVTELTTHTWQPSIVTNETALEAGARQIETLGREIAATDGARPITAVISGGVDSGLVAALAKQAGILDHLATLGTPWGNEYAEAAELGAHLNLPVIRITLSEDEILRALPETIRMIGEPNHETIAGAVNLVAVYQQGRLPLGTVLTGYGADLINSGLRVESYAIDDIRLAVSQRLSDAALASEFSGVAAASHGYALRHMFWSSEVIQAALDTAPELMRFRDREKGHIRAAATELLPDTIAWRPKQALHHGSGVDRNLNSAIARRLGVEFVDVERFYRLIDAELVRALVTSPYEQIDSCKCMEAAIAAYRR